MTCSGLIQLAPAATAASEALSADSLPLWPKPMQARWAGGNASWALDPDFHFELRRPMPAFPEPLLASCVRTCPLLWSAAKVLLN